MDLLESIGHDIDDCSGQTYDKASIMSRQYNGPCAAHSRHLSDQLQFVVVDMLLATCNCFL